MQFFACFSGKIINGISTGPKGQFKIPYILYFHVCNYFSGKFVTPSCLKIS